MVAIETVNPECGGPAGGEAALAAQLEIIAAQWGLATRRCPVGPDGAFNLLISSVVSPEAEWLLFESHLDTVSVEGMTVPPFQLTAAGERLHGRGTCDTKGSGAAMLWALQDYARSPGRTRNAGVIFSVDEEAGMDGARAFAATELTAVYPDVAVYGLPFIFADVDAVRQARAVIDPVIKAGFEKNGMVAAGITGGGFIYLMSTRPIATQAEIRGTKVWVPEGDIIGRIAFEEAGITPVSLALGDVYTSLQTGLIETVGNTTTGAVAFQWATKLKYMVDLPVSYTVGILSFDKKSLDKLSAEDRAAVIASVEAAFARLETLNAADDLATRETLKNEGIAIVPPQPEAAQAWRDVGTRTMARMQSEGQLSAEILSVLKQVGPAGGSR